jgi:hypothetical protein
MPNRKMIVVGALLHAATATNVHTQSAATRKVTVVVQGSSVCDSEIHNSIKVVLDGDERHALTAWHDNPAKPWIGTLTVNEHKIKATGTHASLRLAGLRTKCAESRRDKDRYQDKDEHGQDPEASVASFEFECDERPTQNIEFRTSPESNLIPIGYVRRVKDPGKCTDQAFFDNGPRTAEDVWTTEELRLHLGSDHNPEARGLLVLSPTESARLTFSETIEKLAIHEADSRRLEKRDRIALALTYQRSKGDGSVPHLSSTAIDLDTKLLNEAGVKGLLIKVIK